MPSVRYEYSGKLREIDLLTFFEHIDVDLDSKEVLQHTSLDLVIECKKSQKPWVFFSSSAFVAKDAAPFLKYYSDFDLYFSTKRLPSLLAQIFPSIQDSHYGAQTVPKCTSYHEAFSKTSGRKIYRAVDSVITYLNYKRESRLQGDRHFGNLTEIYVPVIVLDGLLLEASLNKSGIKLHNRSHLQLRTFHRDDIYVIDVVTKNHFEQFFNEMHNFHERLVGAIKSIKFPSELKAAVKAKLKRGWDSPDPWVRDMLLMSSQDSRGAKARHKALRANKSKTNNASH